MGGNGQISDPERKCTGGEKGGVSWKEGTGRVGGDKLR